MCLTKMRSQCPGITPERFCRATLLPAKQLRLTLKCARLHSPAITFSCSTWFPNTWHGSRIWDPKQLSNRLKLFDCNASAHCNQSRAFFHSLCVLMVVIGPSDSFDREAQNHQKLAVQAH